MHLLSSSAVSAVHAVQLKLNENFLCDIVNENTLVCDSARYQFMPFFVERKFAHNRIDKLYLRCSNEEGHNSSSSFSSASSSGGGPWSVASFVRENKKFTALDYNSYITKRDLHELHIVECAVEEQPLSQLLEILFNYNDQFRLKLLNVSGSAENSYASASLEQLDHFLRKNEAVVRSLHVLEVANVHYHPHQQQQHSTALELVHLRHLRRLKLINVAEGSAGGAGQGSKGSINKSVRPLPGAGGSDRGLVRLNSNLLELVLRNNSLLKTTPCSALLRNLSNLEQLDLSHNDLTEDKVENCFQLAALDQDAADGAAVAEDGATGDTRRRVQRLAKLKVLHLDRNRISFRKNRRIFGADTVAAEALRHLEVLALDHNDIDELSEATFAGLSSLVVLTLTGNKLTVIAEHTFRPLGALRQLALDTNRLTNVAALFGTAKQNQLLDLNLNGNQLTELPVGIENSLVRLKSLDLGSNRIATLNGKQFHGLNELLGLRLVDNLLTRISKTAFHLLTSLQIINLSGNRINYLEQDAFQFNQHLQIVRIDQNQLNAIPKNCFKPLTSLLWLNLSNNALNKFYMNELPNSVELLDLHSNKIYEIKNMKGPDYLENLRFLDLSHNHLPLLNEETIPNGLIEINVEDNFITYIEINTFANKNRLTRINLRNNLLSRLESKLFLNKINQNHDLELFLATNPFDCDCSLEWLMILQEAPPQNLQIVDLDEIACTSPIQKRRLMGSALQQQQKHRPSPGGRFQSPEPVRNSSELKANIRHVMEQSSTRLLAEHQQFLCKYESHCHTLCQCCDYELTCDCYMKCPVDCNCYYETTWQTNVVDCGQTNLTAVPTRIPVDATVLYLDGNNFQPSGIVMASPEAVAAGSSEPEDGQSTKHRHLFLGRNKLTVLFLNHSQVATVTNATFYGLSHLRELHLEHNLIRQLSNGDEFEHLTRVERLFLHDNRIAFIHPRSFHGLRHLQVLTLRRNAFGRQEPFKMLVPSVMSRLIIDGVLADLHVGNGFNCDFNCNEMQQAFQQDGPVGEQQNSTERALLLPKFFKSKRANALKCAPDGSDGDAEAVDKSASFVIRAFIERCEFVKEANQQLRLVNKSAAQGAQNAAFREYLRRHYLWPGAEYLPAFAVAGTSILFLLFCIILGVVFRQHIQLMVFSRYGVRLGTGRQGAAGAGGSMGGNAQLTVRRQSNGQLDLEPLCDAWVLCNSRDYAYIESFVVDVMDQMGYYMQITSDWEQLPGSVEAAQRTMLVISSGFLQMEWQNVAFRQALYSMLGKIESRGSVAQRLIVVVAVPLELLVSDQQLVKLIQSATMVQLGEKRFWEKVRFAMPDVLMPVNSSSNCSSRSPPTMPGGALMMAHGANEASRNNWRRKLNRYADESGAPDQPPRLPPKPSQLGAADRSPDGTTTNDYDVLPMGSVTGGCGGGGGGSERSSSTTRGSCIENDEDQDGLGDQQLGSGGGGGNLHNQKRSFSSSSQSSSSAKRNKGMVNGIDNEQQIQKIQSRYHSSRGKHQQQQQHYHPSTTTSGSSNGGGNQQAYFV